MRDADKSRLLKGFEFGEFRLDGRERRLLKGTEPIVLPPKVFDTLLLLVENAGHVLAKRELMSAIWPETVVEEGNLTKNIWLIRRALGETEGDNRYIETVPKVGYRFVAPLRLAEEPSPPAADTVPSTLDAAPAPPETARPVRGRSPALGLAALAAAVLVLGIFWFLRSRAHPRAASPAQAAAGAAASPRRSVAVMAFRNLSGRSGADWLSTAFTEMLAAELAQGEKLRLVPAEVVARLAAGPHPAFAGTLSRNTLASLRARLAADLVLSGSYLAISSAKGEAVRLDMTVQDAATGETLAAVTETGREADLFDLVASAGGRLRASLGLSPTSPSEAGSVAAALPKEPEAARLYAEGLAKLRAEDALGARPFLESSIQAAPDFGPAHAALSLAWSALGYDRKARDEAERAFRLASSAAPRLRTLAEARLAETHDEWPRAESLYASLLRAHPDDLDTGLRLASAQIAGGRSRRALGTLQALARLRAPEGDDPRIDLARADAAAALSQWRDELAASRSAEEKANNRGSTPLLAEAQLREAYALGALGEPGKGRRACEQAAELFRRVGDSNGEARALIGIAVAVGDEGDDEKAGKLYREAQSTFERVGNRKGEEAALSDLAILDWMRGNADPALSEAREVLAINREINDQRGIVWGLTATANILADQGDFEQALALQKEGVGISRKIGDDEYLSYGLASLADTFLAQGRLEDARRNYEAALALSEKLGDAEAEATHENDLGNVDVQEGRISEADDHYARALAGRQKLGLAEEVAETEMLLAGLRNAQGRYAEAAKLSEAAVGVFSRGRQAGNGAIALAYEGRAELALGRLAEARSLCGRARALLRGNRQNGANLPVLVEAVRVETAAANLPQARRLLSELETRARKARWPIFLLESRRASAELAIRSGRTQEGLREMRSVAEDAKSKGFNLIAAQARKVLDDRRAAQFGAGKAR